MIPHIFTPETLAERWGCTSQHVRDMLNSGTLRGFKLGGKKLWRIKAEMVELFEAGGGCAASAGDFALSQAESTAGHGAALVRLIPPKLNGDSKSF